MNSSPVTTWSEFNSRSMEAMFTFADQPMVVSGICLVSALVVGWFLVAAFRFDSHGEGETVTVSEPPDPQGDAS